MNILRVGLINPRKIMKIKNGNVPIWCPKFDLFIGVELDYTILLWLLIHGIAEMYLPLSSPYRK